MKILYVGVDEPWESDLFFHENGVPIAGWACNDANWRSEYMDPLLKACGIEVVSIDADSTKGKRLVKRARKEGVI